MNNTLESNVEELLTLSKKLREANLDLRNKNISGKDADVALVKADIRANKNMVPFDD